MMLYNIIQPKLHATFSSLIHTFFWVAKRLTVLSPVLYCLFSDCTLACHILDASCSGFLSFFPVTLGTEERGSRTAFVMP